MAGGKEEEFYRAGSKRVGNPHASKNPKNDLDSLLDHYLGEFDYEAADFSSYVSDEDNTMHPRGDVDPDSSYDTSWVEVDRD